MKKKTANRKIVKKHLGIEEIIEVDLNKDEHSALSKSVDSVIELLDIMKKN